MKEAGKILWVMVLLAGIIFTLSNVYAGTECQWQMSKVSADSNHTCAVTAGGGVKCWGWNHNPSDILGDGTNMDRGAPVDVLGLTSGVTDVSAGWFHNCVLTSGGGVKCWGYNSNGELGNGSWASQSSPPADVAGLTSGVIAISSGGWHTCALTSNGRVKCWGDNSSGQLGTGSCSGPEQCQGDCSMVPVEVAGLRGVIAVASGHAHTCALTNRGEVKCWGYGNYGNLGNGMFGPYCNPTPTDVLGLTSEVIAISSKYYHTCALISGGGVMCWGQNRYGELGDGTTTDQNIAVNVVGLDCGVAAVSAGDWHTCAVTDGGGAKCWGYNGSGQLGNDYTSPYYSSIPVDVTDLASMVVAIAAGGNHTCAITSEGGAKCWGSNYYGQLGNHNGGINHFGQIVNHHINEISYIPVDVDTRYTYTSQLEPPLVFTPTPIGGGTLTVNWLGSSSVVTGYMIFSDNGTGVMDYSGPVATIDDSRAQSWTTGVLMEGWYCFDVRPTGADQCTVGATSAIACGYIYPATECQWGEWGASKISAGYLDTCAVMPNGGVKCWGNNSLGLLGTGDKSGDICGDYADETCVKTPVNAVVISDKVKEISHGQGHSCFITDTGGVKCWGYNDRGQLGDGTTTNHPTPVDVVGLSSGVVAISVAWYQFTCAITDTGGVKCWGWNSSGQLGDGTKVDKHTPVDVAGLSSGVVAISLGSTHSCAMMASGGVKCWGSNFGITPVDLAGFSEGMTVPVNPETGMSSLSCYMLHCCAVTNSGGVKCWGQGVVGGTGANINIPADVVGLSSGVLGVSCGGDHACAVLDSGGVKCWGENIYGSLGNGNSSGSETCIPSPCSKTPVDVIGLSSGVKTVSSGDHHSCALMQSGEVKCWGGNQYGQLGVGSYVGPGICGSGIGYPCSTIPVEVWNYLFIGDDIQPPQGLFLTPLEGGLARLDWLKSPSAEVTGYEIFSDNRTGGVIDYSSPLAVIDDPLSQSWTSGAIADGNYCFAVRAKSGNVCPLVAVPAIVCGDVYACGTIPCPSDDAGNDDDDKSGCAGGNFDIKTLLGALGGMIFLRRQKRKK